MIVTDDALKQINQELARHNIPGSGIRIFTSNGCCFPSLEMNVVDQACADDKVITINEVDFFIAEEAEQISGKLIIDFTNGHFKFDLGKRSKGCCG